LFGSGNLLQVGEALFNKILIIALDGDHQHVTRVAD
jgi:hypothetical protein